MCTLDHRQRLFSKVSSYVLVVRHRIAYRQYLYSE
uniref:Uncharacterized protein n=1 Tax=Anguilla anguilla TaxID=7936 RepID=A0A0E9QHN0_ANGAN